MRTAAKNMTKEEIEEEINLDFCCVLSSVDVLWEPGMVTDSKEHLEIIAKFIKFLMKANGVKKIGFAAHKFPGELKSGFKFIPDPERSLKDYQKLLRAFRSVKNRL